MTVATSPGPMGRRERNKQAKLDRIVEAAGLLFAAHGVDEVTTQQIADAADIGTGTLFLYAKTKGELLLLVQNAHYADALRRGSAAAMAADEPVEAVMAILEPIVECNRAQVENGRTYLREMLFGDPQEPRHAEALSIVEQTEAAIVGIFRRDPDLPLVEAEVRARAVSAVMFLTMAAGVNVPVSLDAIVAEIRRQVSVLVLR